MTQVSKDELYNRVMNERAQIVNIAAKIARDELIPNFDWNTQNTIGRENLLRAYITPLSQYLSDGLNYYHIERGNPHPPSKNPGPNWQAANAKTKDALIRAKNKAESIVRSPAFKAVSNQLVSEGLSPVEAARTWMFNPNYQNPTSKVASEVIAGERFNQAQSLQREKEQALISQQQRAERDKAIQAAKIKLGTDKVKIVHSADGTKIVADKPEAPTQAARVEKVAVDLLNTGQVNDGQSAKVIAEDIVKQHDDRERLKKMVPWLVIGAVVFTQLF